MPLIVLYFPPAPARSKEVKSRKFTRGRLVRVLVFALLSLLARGFFLLALLPREVDFDSVHTPDVCNLALCNVEELETLFIELSMVPVYPFHC